MNKFFERLLDFLMFVVPLLELTQVIAFIPAAYLPHYIVAVVILRRTLRFMQGKKDDQIAKKDIP